MSYRVIREEKWVKQWRLAHRVLLGCRDLLHAEGIVEQAMAWEVLHDVLLDKLDTVIRIVHAFDLVSNTRD
jgi:hypothetical protein